MNEKKILYISGSVGLGHITRDLAIAGELRRQYPGVKIAWLAASPADQLLKDAGENLLPEASESVGATAIAEDLAQGDSLNLITYTLKALKELPWNAAILDRVLSKERFDVIIGDETYELLQPFNKVSRLKKYPFVMIDDFIGVDAMTDHWLEKLAVYWLNFLWLKVCKDYLDLLLFDGELEDIPDKRFGFLLPKRRAWAKKRCKFIGYVLPFDPSQYTDKFLIRKKLGYGSEPLVLCSIGGKAIGRELLELCGRAYTVLKERIPDIRMVLVCGPRLSADSLDLPSGVEVRGYVPNLYEHFAACDLAIVQGSGTTTLELTALRRPFIYSPIRGHFEQEKHVAYRLSRHRAGIKVSLSEMTPSSLAEMVIANLGKAVTYPPIPVDGAKRLAQLIGQYL